MNEVEEIIQWLFEDEAKEMKKICNKYMVKFGGISEMDHDDFYSQVGWDVSIASKNYHPTDDKSFKEFIYGVIKLSVCKQMTHRNRGKRQLIVEKEIVDEWVQVTLVKTFNDEKAPDAYVEITYDVDNGNFPGMGGDADYEEEEELEENAF